MVKEVIAMLRANPVKEKEVVEEIKTETSENVETASYVTVRTQGNAKLNVRKSPSVSSQVIDKVDNGAKLKCVADTQDGWYKVVVNNHVGYIDKKYASPLR